MLQKKIITVGLSLLLSTPVVFAETLTEKTNRLEREVQQLKKVLYSEQHDWSHFVISSPYLGLRSSFDGSDTITNLPSINEDMRLLQQRQLVRAVMKKHRLAFPKQPVIELSGKIEGIAYFADPYLGDEAKGTNLSTAELDIGIHAHEWVSGFMAINYDDAPDFINRNFAANSRMFLNKGFVTVGNLDKTPFYMSFGQMFLPFGRYSSGMVSSPLTAWLGKTRARAINFGYRNKDGCFAQAYAFNSSMETRSINYGFNLGFEGAFKNGMQLHLAGGMMSDLADSNGMQSNGNLVFTASTAPTNFGGFGKHTATGVTKLEHPVSGGNIHARLGMGNWNVLAEYVAALRRFDRADLLVNNHGAKPNAFQAEAVYGFKMLRNKPSHFAVGYGRAHDGLPLLIPSRRYTATLSTSLWRNTIQAIEFRHDKLYSNGTTAFGKTTAAEVTGVDSVATSDPNGKAGNESNMVVLQMGLYF